MVVPEILNRFDMFSLPLPCILGEDECRARARDIIFRAMQDVDCKGFGLEYQMFVDIMSHRMEDEENVQVYPRFTPLEKYAYSSPLQKPLCMTGIPCI